MATDLLSPQQRAEQLKHYERFCRPKGSSISVGSALRSIRDERLYRGTHGTFEEYVKARWGLSMEFAAQYMGEVKATPRKPKHRESCVYFIQCGDQPLVKIGVALDALKRLADLQVASPFDLRLIATIPGADAKRERELHKVFKYLHVRGEWFTLAPAMEDFISKSAVRHGGINV